MRNVVVGVESTAAAERALDRALAEAVRRQAPLTIVRAWQAPVWVGAAMGQVYDYDVFAAVVSSGDAAHQEVAEMLEKALARLPEGTHAPRTSLLVEEGPAEHVLLAAAADAAVLVLGTRRHTAIGGALFGRTSGHVLHHSDTPVLLVPAEGTPVSPYHRVLVGVDGSEASRSALRFAAAVAAEQGCPLVAVHAWLMTALPEAVRLEPAAGLAAFEHGVRSWVRAEVHQVLAAAQAFEVDVRHGVPGRELLCAAATDDLLVVGSRGRGGFAGLRLGSVSAYCARHLRSTLAVVHAGEERLES